MIEFIEEVEKKKFGYKKLSEEILIRLGWTYKVSMASWWNENNDLLLDGRNSNITESVDSALLVIQNGWGIQNLWEAANPKDRPWWGCNLRRDEPYMLVKALGAATPALVICGAILRIEMEEKLQRLVDLGQEMEEK